VGGDGPTRVGRTAERRSLYLQTSAYAGTGRRSSSPMMSRFAGRCRPYGTSSGRSRSNPSRTPTMSSTARRRSSKIGWDNLFGSRCCAPQLPRDSDSWAEPSQSGGEQPRLQRCALACPPPWEVVGLVPTDPAPPDLGRGLSPGRGRVKRGERSLPRATPGVRALLGRGQVLPGPAPERAISTSVRGARTAQPGRSPRRSVSAAAWAWHGRSERRPRTPASFAPRRRGARGYQLARWRCEVACQWPQCGQR
jgi:hypothetical protein